MLHDIDFTFLNDCVLDKNKYFIEEYINLYLAEMAFKQNIH